MPLKEVSGLLFPSLFEFLTNTNQMAFLSPMLSLLHTLLPHDHRFESLQLGVVMNISYYPSTLSL